MKQGIVLLKWLLLVPLFYYNPTQVCVVFALYLLSINYMSLKQVRLLWYCMAVGYSIATMLDIGCTSEPYSIVPYLMYLCITSGRNFRLYLLLPLCNTSIAVRYIGYTSVARCLYTLDYKAVYLVFSFLFRLILFISISMPMCSLWHVSTHLLWLTCSLDIIEIIYNLNRIWTTNVNKN